MPDAKIATLYSISLRSIVGKTFARFVYNRLMILDTRRTQSRNVDSELPDQQLA